MTKKKNSFRNEFDRFQLCRNMMSGWQRVFLDDRQVPIMIKGYIRLIFVFILF